MKSIDFAESNYVEVVDETPIYQLRNTLEAEGVTHKWTIMCIQLSWQERLQVFLTGRLWKVESGAAANITVNKSDLINTK